MIAPLRRDAPALLKQPDAPAWLPSALHPGRRHEMPHADYTELSAEQRKTYHEWLVEWSTLHPHSQLVARMAWEMQGLWWAENGMFRIPWDQLTEHGQRKILDKIFRLRTAGWPEDWERTFTEPTELFTGESEPTLQTAMLAFLLRAPCDPSLRASIDEAVNRG